MSNRNDEVFADFMMRLAKKMIEREDEKIALIAELELEMASRRQGATKVLPSTLNPTQGIVTPPPIQPKPLSQTMKTALKTLSGPRTLDPQVSKDEMAVIRAYFNGEDVLTTILSQER